jgi:4-hydroxy-4-methyl-2-oxoglutarate aldolase
LAAGELGLDIYNMREALAAKGLVYEDYDPSKDA